MKFRASLPLPFGFICNPFCPRCSELMLSFSMNSDCRADKCLLTLHILKFAFPSSCRMIGLDNTILQLGSCFEIFDFKIFDIWYFTRWRIQQTSTQAHLEFTPQSKLQHPLPQFKVVLEIGIARHQRPLCFIVQSISMVEKPHQLQHSSKCGLC